MKLSQRMILSSYVVAFILCAAPREAHAWWSVYFGGDTHWDITKDVLDNKLADETLHLDVDYPDLLMFKDVLMNGSNMESHNVPDGLATAWWWPDKDDQIPSWFYSGRIIDGQPIEYGALWAYTNYFFYSAYINVGRELHLVQDQSVPAHKLYCCHGESDFDVDDLEAKASGYHFYWSPTEDWTFSLDHVVGGVVKTSTFSYWLDDANDDDDDDDILGDTEADEGTIVDGPEHDWGVTKFAWGTYGVRFMKDQAGDKHIVDFSPGRDMGIDYFMEVADNEKIGSSRFVEKTS